MSLSVEDPRFVKNEPGQIKGNKAEDAPIDSVFSFCFGIVSEYIANPADYLNREQYDKTTRSSLGKLKDVLVGESDVLNRDSIVENPEIAKYMPHNSIMCYVSRGGGSNSRSTKPVIAYPFFPQHFTLPLKPTERVWILKEEKGNQTNYYWMCRVPSDRQVDDLNLTSFDRNFHIRTLYNEFESNGSVSSNDFLIPATSFVPSPNSPMPDGKNPDHILGSSVSFMETFTGEPVPRKVKDADDLLLQGSNNTMIHLCKEKFLAVPGDDSKIFTNQNAKQYPSNKRKPLRGTIDIVAGREKERLYELAAEADPSTLSTQGKFNTILNNRANAEGLEFYETDKIDEPQGRNENRFEGDDSPRNVFARTYLSMNAAPDVSFEFNNEDFEKFSGPSHVSYSDHCRVYAEQSLRLYKYENDSGIDSCIDMAPDGTITLQSGEGLTASKLILRPDGNIVLKPGLGGVLYLGADEEDSTGAPAVAPANPDTGTGLVVGVQPADTFGGVGFLNTPLTGNLSDKVRIKIPGV